MLYSMPALTGIKIEPETIARLSEHSNIIGAKDSSNDIAGFTETVRLCPDNFAIMTGNGTVLLDALQAGATGGILAVGCVAPEMCVEIFRAFNAAEREHATALQSKLTPRGGHDEVWYRRFESGVGNGRLSRRHCPCAAANAG